MLHERFSQADKSALSTPPLPPFNCSNGGSFDSEVVGESNYQEELRWLLSRHGVDGVARIEVRPEPQNKYDKNAVVVLSDRSRTVGYVPKDVAWIIQPPLAAFVKQHGKAWCQGQLRGGVMAAPSIGIWLDLDLGLIGVPQEQIGSRPGRRTSRHE